MNNYNPTEMLAEEMMARMTAANRELDQLRAALAAATARAEAAEKDAVAFRCLAYECKQLLAAVPEYASYYAAAWEAFEADSDGPEPLDFAEWLEQQNEVQP